MLSVSFSHLDRKYDNETKPHCPDQKDLPTRCEPLGVRPRKCPSSERGPHDQIAITVIDLKEEVLYLINKGSMTPSAKRFYGVILRCFSQLFLLYIIN